MANWLYTLKIKDLLANEGPDFDYGTHSVEVAPEAAKRVRSLMIRVEGKRSGHIEQRVGDLYAELDEVADLFESIASPDTCDGDPQATFNEAMEFLYDVGDDGHRVWID